MDGYAVRATDTFGTTESLPAYLALIGESPMGSAPIRLLHRGEAMIIHTGGMLPEGADAVVMIERTQRTTDNEIEVMRAAAPGENVLHVGEDVKPGDPLFSSGHLLRPQDLGGLMALGITQVSVARQPRVAILATGDEVIDPHDEPQPGQVTIASGLASGPFQDAQEAYSVLGDPERRRRYDRQHRVLSLSGRRRSPGPEGSAEGAP